MEKTSAHPLWWHPHQKLWNWELVKTLRERLPNRRVAGYAVKSVIYLDTLLLDLELKRGRHNVNRSGYTPDKPINYFDLGTHEEAREIQLVYREVLAKLPNPHTIYAFEANPASCAKARAQVGHVDNLHFFNLALVREMPEGEHVRLFIAGDGLGDSIYRQGKGDYVDVPAKRLSDVIREEQIDLPGSINILRMNIEGCEYDVIQDLVDHDLIRHFHGFYGMWDDVAKIDPQRDEQFRALMREVGVHPFPFNGRDLKFPMRRNLIIKSLRRSIKG